MWGIGFNCFFRDIIGKTPLWRDESCHQSGPRCPRCGHHFQKLCNEARGQTVPEGGFVCEHCRCRIDAFGNELSFPADNNDPKCW